MKLLIVADHVKLSELAGALPEDFGIALSAGVKEALAQAEQDPFDTVLVHLDLGESGVLDLICALKRLSEQPTPGIVVLARELDRRAIVELVRTGAFDVQLESALQTGELVHALRNAAYFARSAASLGRRREERSKQPASK